MVGLIYLVRQMVLYLYVPLMPLLIVLWVPGVGPFTHLARLMSRLAGFYVPFLFMTVPIALLFRMGELLGESVTLSMGGFGRWLLAIVTPLIAMVIPFVLFWQAGALFFMADRAAQHSSRQRARERKDKTQRTGERGRLGLKNLRRGIAGQSAIRSSGKTVLGSGSSTAHTVETKVHRTKRTLRSRVQSSTASRHSRSRGSDSNTTTESKTRTEEGNDAPSDSSPTGDESGESAPSEGSTSESETTETDEISSDSESSDSDDSGTDTDDDNPRYIY